MLFPRLDPFIVGRIMRKIRIDDGTKLIELAETLEVDRTTVQLIESLIMSYFVDIKLSL